MLNSDVKSMNKEHMKRLKEISETTNTSLVKIIELYSEKQTQYANKQIYDGSMNTKLLYCEKQGQMAVGVMEKYIERKGVDQFKKLVDSYNKI